MEVARNDENDDDGVVVEEKVALLRQLVPSGKDMEVDGLLEEMIDYIITLKQRVGLMHTLACMLPDAGITCCRRWRMGTSSHQRNREASMMTANSPSFRLGFSYCECFVGGKIMLNQ